VRIRIRYAFRLLRSVYFLLTCKKLKDGDIFDAVVVIFNKRNLRYWLVSDPGLKDRLAYQELRAEGYRVCVSFNPSAKQFHSGFEDCLLWLNPHHFMFTNSRRGHSYREDLHTLIDEYSQQFRRVIPSAEDIRLWENKLYMHERFEEANVRHPFTELVRSPDELSSNFPVILKSDDGYSSNGLWKCDTKEQALVAFQDRTSLLAQEFLNISFDIRVICVAGEIASFYWRKNDTQEVWRPTATQNGATVQFCTLPDSARKLAIQAGEALGLLTFGADICFRNDDLSDEPYVLEVSPIYQPNPTPPEEMVTTKYSNFKSGSILRYDIGFERLVRSLFQRVLLNDRLELER